MRKSFLISSICIFFTTILAACSGGGSSLSTGKVCPDTFTNPVAMKPSANQKVVSLKVGQAATGEALLPAGHYTYDHADLYYRDKSGYQVYVQDVKQQNGTYKAVINCVSGITPDDKLADMTITATGATDIQVSADQKAASVSQKSYGFMITGTRFVVSSDAVADKVDSPDKVYDVKGVSSIMLATGNNAYEIQSSAPAPDNRGVYYLSVHLIRSNN